MNVNSQCAAATAAFVGFGLLAGAGHAAVRFVDDSAPAGGNGQSWATAFSSLSAALQAAAPGDEIRIGQGAYRPGSLRTSTFTLRDGVTLRGGYAGYGAINPNARDPALFRSVLTGDMLGNDGAAFANIADNAFQVVTAPSTITPSTVLDGLYITGGNADGAFGSQDRGGGMTCAGSPTIIACTFAANSASGGGAISISSTGNPTLKNCTFVGNRATGATTFNAGGAVHVGGNAEITGCTFAGNSAAAGNGGGLSMSTSTSGSKLLNSVFSANQALLGGGAFTGPAPILNCTFAFNAAVNGGGGLAVAPTASPSVTNSILWNNTSTLGGRQLSGSATVTYSCVTGGLPGVGNMDADPRFLNPAGADDTLGTEDDNYRLAGGPTVFSPCIDAGNSTPARALMTTDLDGRSRFADHPVVANTGAGAGEPVDVGPFEAVPLACSVDFNGDGTINADDLSDFITAYFSGSCP